MACKRIGLCLSGGGLRGFSQVAVLHDLEKQRIEIGALAGSSMGAIVAAMTACGHTAKSLEARAVELENRFHIQKIFHVRPILRNLITSKAKVDGLVDQTRFADFCCEFFREDGITMLSEVEKPLAITSVDINSGRLFVFTNRRECFREDPSWSFYPEDIELGKAVAASCAFPLVFSTAEVGGYRMVDGGVRMNTPAPLFKRDGLDGVLSVTMAATDIPPIPQDPIKLAIRSIDLLMIGLGEIHNQSADIVVNFPFPLEETFNVGHGRKIIDDAREMLLQHPIDYSVLEKPGLPGTIG